MHFWSVLLVILSYIAVHILIKEVTDFTKAQRKKRIESIKPILNHINEFDSKYQKIFNPSRYVKESFITYLKNKHLDSFNKLSNLGNRVPNEYKEKVNDFLNKYNSLDHSRAEHNETYISNLKETVGPELNKIFNKTFENSQFDAIFHDEDNNLVIAGAGTGKTQTLLEKPSF